MKLYLGNLGRTINDEQLRELVAPYGTPQTAEVAKDRSSGDSKGFGFVEFATDEEAKAAIAGLDGKDHNGQNLKVSEAKPKEGSKHAGGGPRR